MIRLMCDSDNPSTLIPTPIVLTYADLIASDAELAALASRFPGSNVALIDRNLGNPSSSHACCIVDIEPGAWSVADGAERIRDLMARGFQFVTAYADRSEMPQVEAALAGLTGWWHWWATLDGTMRIPGHPTQAVQFAPESLTGGHYDLSIVYDDNYSPGVIG